MPEVLINVNKIKNLVANQVVTAFGVVATLILFSVFLRDYPDHFGFHFYAQCVLLASIWIVAFYKNKLSLESKIYFLVVCLLLVLVNSFIYLGFLASAKLYIVLAPALVSYIQSFRRSVLFLVGFLLVYMVLGYLFVSDILQVHVMANDYILSPKTWITETILIFLVTLCLLYVGNTYLRALVKNLNIIKDQNKILTEKEAELTLHRDNLEALVHEKTKDLDEALQNLKVSNDELLSKNEIILNKNLELKNTLSDLKQAQAQLIHSEKMASLGILTAGVAHEINNPLNYILGGATGLETIVNSSNIKDENVDFCLDAIKTGVQRASSIVSGLNQMSRTNDTYDEVCDIHEILDNCVSILTSKLRDRVEIVKHYGSNPYTILGNTGKLHQAFLNILNNASQSIEGAGTITLTTTFADEQATVLIADTGHGILPENLNKVTDPFFTTRDPGEGTGLGLSITDTIITEHKGTMEFQSEPGAGTTVKVEFSKH